MRSDRSRDRDAPESPRRRAVLRGAAALAAAGALPACLEVQPDGLEDGLAGDGAGGDGMAGGADGGGVTDGPTGERDGGSNGTDAGDGTSVDGTASDEALAARERAVHERVNEVRAEHDVPELSFHGGIAGTAREHSADMAERGYVGHETPEGERPDDRMAEFFPGECSGIGENIAAVPREPGDPEAVADRVVQGWLDSPGHRENLLREAFDSHGIGAAFGERRVLVTQKFCAEGGGVFG